MSDDDDFLGVRKRAERVRAMEAEKFRRETIRAMARDLLVRATQQDKREIHHWGGRRVSIAQHFLNLSAIAFDQVQELPVPTKEQTHEMRFGVS